MGGRFNEFSLATLMHGLEIHKHAGWRRAPAPVHSIPVEVARDGKVLRHTLSVTLLGRIDQAFNL